MAKFLITGDPGSGKSALAEALARRGYTAHDTDDLPDVTCLEDTAGRPVDWPEPPVDWSRYGWNWQEAGLRERLGSAETVFVAAIVSNQEQHYSWFDAIFVLMADPATLRQRLLSRNGYGKHPAELAGILDGYAERAAELLSAPHAVAIDATRPLARVADDVIACAQACTTASSALSGIRDARKRRVHLRVEPGLVPGFRPWADDIRGAVAPRWWHGG